jgi:predicted nucleic acid-binding protein
MPFVVVDTSVSLPATVSPGGLTRKFFVLLAYGAVSYEVEHGQLELDELAKQAEAAGGQVMGLD